jgi:hypothetical protein
LGHSEAANLLGNAFDANTQGPVQNVAYQGSANYTHTFNANTILTATAGARHSWAHTRGDAFNGTTVGIPADLATNPIGGIQTAPSIEIDGYAAGNGNGHFGGQEYSVLLYGQDVGHVEASVSHVIHNHELKAGGEVRLHRINFTQWGIPNGRWEYQNSATASDANNSSSGRRRHGQLPHRLCHGMELVSGSGPAGDAELSVCRVLPGQLARQAEAYCESWLPL